VEPGSIRVPSVSSARPIRPVIGARHLGLGLLLGREGRVELRLAGGGAGQQLLEPVGLLPGEHEGRFLAGQRRFGAGEFDLVRRRVDLVEDVAFLDLAALFEQALDHEAGYPGADFGDAHGRDAARQVAEIGDCLGLNGDEPHLRHRWSRGRGLLRVAGGEAEHEQDRGRANG
jgi:hypothetical protein